MSARQDQRKNNEPTRDERDNNKHTKTNEKSNKPRVFAFAGETRRDDTNHSFQLYTHNAAERRVLRDQRQNTKLANSLVKKFLRKRNERRKATNNTNEYS
tara:strand:+ start:107 stop:406 length:300 start_codon:yes stop_codon:yes gene_type:complete